MTGFDTEFIELFRDETARRLDDMDNLLLEIESGDADADVVNSLFRHAHTIKGAAGMLGFDDVRALAHGAEDVLARVRDADRFSPEIATPLLRATAAMRVSIAGSAPRRVSATCPSTTARPRPSRRPRRASGPAEAARRHRGRGFRRYRPPRPRGRPGGGRAPAGRGPGARQAPGMQSSTLRVPADKIDHLLDVAGEILQHRRTLAHSLGHQAQLSQDVADLLGAGERMLDDLTDTAVAMRTLPLEVITAGLPRVVRDLARAAGKEVEFDGQRGGHRARPGDPGEPVRAAHPPAAQRGRARHRAAGRARAGGQAAAGHGSSCARNRGAAWSRSWSRTTAAASRPR